MQSVEFERVKAIFADAMEKNVSERGVFLDSACGNDAPLRAEVEAFLSAAQRAGDFLNSPTSNVAAPTLDSPEGSLGEGPGKVIGRYKLLQLIGEGGFGSVFMAEQETPVRRKVALKIIKLGMDTKQVIARFDAERQALAMMEHPNIAKVLDAGATESGRPYFVMELVRGIPILEYCDGQKLTTRQRVELFIQVCHAIQHAHQKGVIHRDIKPSNVLVTMHDDKPVPKVIDFGIAKATSARLTDKTLFTEYRQFIGTPAYMSPEQAQLSGLDVDTRSDIYSLGVLLYELLTGSTPFDSEALYAAAYDEIRRIIREVEPPKPSTRISSLGATLSDVARLREIDPRKLAQCMKGELDWIVMKCLEKDRTRRYETANSLALDIQRYLSDEPVEASPPSASYRFRRFAWKYRAPLRVAAAFALLLVAATVVSSGLAVRATRAKAAAIAAEHRVSQERDRVTAEKQRADGQTRVAREQADVAQAINNFLNEDVLGYAEPWRQIYAGIDPNLDLKVRDGLDRAASRIPLRFENQPLVEAAIRHTIGNAYGELGDYDKAADHLRAALRLSRRAGSEVDKLRILSDLGRVYCNQGWYAKAEPLLVEATAGMPRVLGDHDPFTLATRVRLGVLYHHQQRYGEAERVYLDALEREREFLGDQSPVTLSTLNNLGELYSTEGKYDKAETFLLEALDGDRKSLPAMCPEILSTLTNLANLYYRKRQYAKAEPLLLEELDGRRTTLGPQRPSTLATLHKLGNLYMARGQYAKAEPPLIEALEGRRKVLGAQDLGTLATLFSLGTAYYQEGQDSRAWPIWQELGEWCVAHPAGDPRNGLTVVGVLPNLISCCRVLGKQQEAMAWQQRLRTALESDVTAMSLTIVHGALRGGDASGFINSRGQLYQRLGRIPEAVADFSAYLEVRPDDHEIRYRMGCMQLYLGDEPAYRGTCRELLLRFGDTTDHSIADRIAKLCLLVPGAVDDLAQVMRLAELAVSPGPPTRTMHSHQTCKGLAEYRAGNFDAAADWLTRSREGFARILATQGRVNHDQYAYAEGMATVNFYLAMAEFRLGRVQQSRETFNLAQSQLDTEVPQESSASVKVGQEDWLIVHIAAREAEALMGAEMSATMPEASTRPAASTQPATQSGIR